MILKQADDKTPQITALESLLAHPRLPPDKKPCVEKALTLLRVGMGSSKTRTAYASLCSKVLRRVLSPEKRVGWRLVASRR